MTKLTLSVCLFLFCYFKAKALKPSKYSRSFLNSHIYIRNGVLVSKTKKSSSSLPSVFSPSQTIHSASSRPLPNISLGICLFIQQIFIKSLHSTVVNHNLFLVCIIFAVCKLWDTNLKFPFSFPTNARNAMINY